MLVFQVKVRTNVFHVSPIAVEKAERLHYILAFYVCVFASLRLRVSWLYRLGNVENSWCSQNRQGRDIKSEYK